ncbi:TetR/AcrR family transcriptional regulator [Corynebacterium sp. H130]|uniref:TetR/AcrR family transcriptional regulator n=1 Tax=Corynebacterium sp. H130 TaxID=3133444 RepID=UPI0030A9C729
MKQTRRTGEELLDAIAEAVRSELAEHGVAGVTYEGVARRAQTSKPVLYRRFSTRAQMIYFSLAGQTRARLKAKMHDSLRENLLELYQAMHVNVSELGYSNGLALFAEATPELRQQITDTTFSPLLIHLKECVEMAVDNGELPGPLPSERLLRLPFACAIAEVVTKGEITDEAVTDIVDNIVLPAFRAK